MSALKVSGRVASIASLCAAEVTPFIEGIEPHEVRVLAGCDAVALRERLAVAPATKRPILLLDLSRSTVQGLLDEALAQLAQAVGDLWPYGWGGEDFSAARDDALTLRHLPIRLAALAERVDGLSQTWARQAVGSLLRGGGLRGHGPAELEWHQLALMFSPGGLVVAVAPDPADAPEPFIVAVEWLAARAPVAVVVLAELPLAQPWARLLYGVSVVATAPPDPGEASTVCERLAMRAPVLLGGPAVEGRPHPLSAVELRLFRHIQADTKLQPLFGFNIVIGEIPLLHAKVDLLWREGRVAVEIDGGEHRAAARYRADRERDYRLMCAGYRVLRLTNEEVAEDCGRAVEKIREVVRLAGGERG